jgi:hypothetical protein
MPQITFSRAPKESVILDWEQITNALGQVGVKGKLQGHDNVYVLTSPLTMTDDAFIYGILEDKYQLGEEKK